MTGLVWAKPGNGDWRLCVEILYLSDGWVDYVAFSDLTFSHGSDRGMVTRMNGNYEILRDE